MNGRIAGNIDGYYRDTNDLLNQVKIPVGTNFNAQMYQNIGSLENYGVEFSINAKPIVTKDFMWDLTYNFTWNHNEITELTGGNDADYYVETGNSISAGTIPKYKPIKLDIRPIHSMYINKYTMKAVNRLKILSLTATVTASSMHLINTCTRNRQPIS